MAVPQQAYPAGSFIAASLVPDCAIGDRLAAPESPIMAEEEFGDLVKPQEESGDPDE
jgi:hypothetical protein